MQTCSAFDVNVWRISDQILYGDDDDDDGGGDVVVVIRHVVTPRFEVVCSVLCLLVVRY